MIPLPSSPRSVVRVRCQLSQDPRWDAHRFDAKPLSSSVPLRMIVLIVLSTAPTVTVGQYCWGCASYPTRNMYMLRCNWHLSCCTAVSDGNFQSPQASFPWSVPLEFNHEAVIGPLNTLLSRLGHDTTTDPAFRLLVQSGTFRVCNGICNNQVWSLSYYAVGFARQSGCAQATARINNYRPSYTGPTLLCASEGGYWYVCFPTCMIT